MAPCALGAVGALAASATRAEPMAIALRGADGALPCGHMKSADSTPTDSTPTGSTQSGGSFRELRVCRFCLQGDDDDDDVDLGSAQSGTDDGGAAAAHDFVEPCQCRGSCRYVHMGCLVHHFEAQGDWYNFRCPSCKQQYEGRALKELAEISRRRTAELHGAASPQAAHSVCHLAQAHAQLGESWKSRELLEGALAASELHYGKDHIMTGNTLCDLAAAHSKLGDAQQAVALLRRCLLIKEQHFGVGHLHTAVTLNNLATSHSELGNVEEQRRLLERSLEIKEKHFGKEHVSTTAALVNLAGVHAELGDVSLSKQLLETSLQIEEKHFGAGHIESAITLNNLALACGESGDVQRMKELLLQSLRVKERHLGSEHQDLCLTLVNLGVACASMVQHAPAKEYCERALRASSAQEAAYCRRRGIVLLRAAVVHDVLGEDTVGSALAIRAADVLQQSLGRAAGERALASEGLRMSRIWRGVQRPDIAQRVRWRCSLGASAEHGPGGAPHDLGEDDAMARTLTIVSL